MHVKHAGVSTRMFVCVRACTHACVRDCITHCAPHRCPPQPHVLLPTRTHPTQVVSTNLLGVLLCSKTALGVFAQQPGGRGHLFNMDGAGEEGGSGCSLCCPPALFFRGWGSVPQECCAGEGGGVVLQEFCAHPASPTPCLTGTTHTSSSPQANTTPDADCLATPCYAAYGATKAAIVQLTRSLLIPEPTHPQAPTAWPPPTTRPMAPPRLPSCSSQGRWSRKCGAWATSARLATCSHPA